MRRLLLPSYDLFRLSGWNFAGIATQEKLHKTSPRKRKKQEEEKAKFIKKGRKEIKKERKKEARG